MDEQDEARNRDAQERLYGRPLGVLLRRYATALQITQGRLAELLGVSAPMLSQLANGRRVRFGNPAAVQRLQALEVAVAEVEAGDLAVADALDRLERNRVSDVFTSTRSLDEPGLATARRVFAAAGDPDQHRAAAAALAAEHPRIARMLETFGAGSEQEARAALARMDQP